MMMNRAKMIMAVYMIALSLLLFFVMLKVVNAYEFVYCYHEPTNSTITYPEGTECDD